MRKLANRRNLELIKGVDDINHISADFPTTELRTKGGSLSTWKIDSIDQVDEAILAIAISSSQISRMDFIIIDTRFLDERVLNYAQTFAGINIAVPDLQNTHYDIQNISIDDLIKCCDVYKTIVDIDESEGEDVFIIRRSEGEIKDIIKRALSSNRIDLTRCGKIKDTVAKLQIANKKGILS